ncbi:MAG TPA: hypothetical protein VIL47_01610 [Candidatus Bipolaricaulota bacterium]
MKEFRIKMLNRPGELDRLTHALAGTKVNIKALAAVVSSPQPLIGIVGDEDAKVREALEKGGYAFEEHDLVMISMPDQPGELARVTRKLADALVNIESVYLIAKAGMEVQFGLTVDNMQKAKHALGK